MEVPLSSLGLGAATPLSMSEVCCRAWGRGVVRLWLMIKPLGYAQILVV